MWRISSRPTRIRTQRSQTLLEAITRVVNLGAKVQEEAQLNLDLQTDSEAVAGLLKLTNTRFQLMPSTCIWIPSTGY